MKIKTILLASASLFCAGQSAFAQAVTAAAEPEAIEYVRVCDAYGEGYFYIPGTETCLKIGGYIRYDVGYGELFGLYSNGIDGGDSFQKYANFNLQISTSAETDFGTLSTYVEANFGYGDQRDDDEIDNGDAVRFGTATELYYAYIDLAGLRVGLDDSAYSQFNGYAGEVINDDLIGYGPFETSLISYTYDNGNGFSAIISLEDDAGAGRGYVPNVVAGAKYSAGDFGVSAVVGYEEAIKKASGKVRVDGKVGSVTLFAMAGYGSVIIDTVTGDEVAQTYKSWGGKWAVWGGASAALTEKATLNAQLSYDAAKTFAAVGNVAYEVAPGFTVTSEVGYLREQGTNGSVGGVLRFEREF